MQGPTRRACCWPIALAMLATSNEASLVVVLEIRIAQHVDIS
jgi:hypothetical protein